MKKAVSLFISLVMLLSFAGCGHEAAESSASVSASPAAAEPSPTAVESSSAATDSTPSPTPSPAETEPAAQDDLVDGMRPEFKEAMDSYEAFYDDYCEFMKLFADNSSDVVMLAKYAEMLSQLADMDAKFAAWEDEDLNDTELKYYIEVSSRISQKLIDASAYMS